LKFVDDAFLAEMERGIYNTELAYEQMRFRDVIKYGFFDFSSLKEEYKIRCGSSNMRLDLVLKYIEAQLTILYPICPHFSDIVYKTHLYPVFD